MSIRVNRRTVGALFLAALAVLVFVSRTIYTHNLPRVSGVLPHNGRLHKREIVVGIADWAQMERLYAAVGGTVEDVLVREGERVEEGQELLRLRFDQDNAERRLREIANSRGRLEADIVGVRLEVDKVRRAIERLEQEEDEEETVSDYEREALALQIRQARQRLRDAQERYRYDEAEESELREIQHALEALYLQETEAARQADEAREKALRAVEESRLDRERRREDYEDQLQDLEWKLRTKSLDMQDLALQEEPYFQALEQFDTYAVLRAPASGTVLELPLNNGQAAGESALLAVVGVGEEFLLQCALPLENTFVAAGDPCGIKNGKHSLKGVVETVRPAENGKAVQVRVTAAELTAGESFDITFEQESNTTQILVPNGAVHRDNSGYFVYQIKRREGIMGEEYFLERLGVTIGDSDAENTAIVQGISFFEPIAKVFDRPVAVGQSIVLTNEGDFSYAP